MEWEFWSGISQKVGCRLCALAGAFPPHVDWRAREGISQKVSCKLRAPTGAGTASPPHVHQRATSIAWGSHSLGARGSASGRVWQRNTPVVSAAGSPCPHRFKGVHGDACICAVPRGVHVVVAPPVPFVPPVHLHARERWVMQAGWRGDECRWRRLAVKRPWWRGALCSPAALFHPLSTACLLPAGGQEVTPTHTAD